MELDRYRAELETVRDTTTLRRLVQAQEPGRADSTVAALGWLPGGFTRLRLGHAGDGWSFGRAAGDFTTAADLRPRWPVPWYGVALAQQGRAEWLAEDRTNLGSRVGYGPLAEALRAARQALTVEPGYLPALTVMVDAASPAGHPGGERRGGAGPGGSLAGRRTGLPAGAGARAGGEDQPHRRPGRFRPPAR